MFLYTPIGKFRIYFYFLIQRSGKDASESSATYCWVSWLGASESSGTLDSVMIEGAEVVRALSESVRHGTQIGSERAAQELVKLKPEERAGIVQEVVDER